MHLPIGKKTLSSRQLLALFNETAYKLLLGVRMMPKQEISESLSLPRGIKASLMVIAAMNGSKLVTLSRQALARFDTPGSHMKGLVRRTLNNFKKAAKPSPCPGVVTSYNYKVALSSDAGLLAIAHHRIIQICDLSQIAPSTADAFPSQPNIAFAVSSSIKTTTRCAKHWMQKAYFYILVHLSAISEIQVRLALSIGKWERA